MSRIPSSTSVLRRTGVPGIPGACCSWWADICLFEKYDFYMFDGVKSQATYLKRLWMKYYEVPQWRFELACRRSISHHTMGNNSYHQTMQVHHCTTTILTSRHDLHYPSLPGILASHAYHCVGSPWLPVRFLYPWGVGNSGSITRETCIMNPQNVTFGTLSLYIYICYHLIMIYYK